MSGDASSQLDPVVVEHLQKMVEGLAEEFAGIYDRDLVQRRVDESAEQLAARGNVTEFIPVLAYRFARERLRARARSAGLLATDVVEVLFVSLLGGGRAQLAAALLSRRAGARASVHSAGSEAGVDIDRNVRTAMEEIGIDLSEAYTKPLSAEVLAGVDVIVTMGRSVGLVEIPAGTRHLDWRVGDPAGADLDEVRRVRDDIARRVDAFADELLGSPAADSDEQRQAG